MLPLLFFYDLHVLCLAMLLSCDFDDALCRYTMKKSTTSESGQSVYAFLLKWPEDNTLTLGAPVTATNTRIQLLGVQTNLKFVVVGKTVQIALPYLPPGKLPNDVAWMLKFDNLKNSWTKFDRY